MNSIEEKRAHRDAHFATDIANARGLGKRLVERAQDLILGEELRPMRRKPTR